MIWRHAIVIAVSPYETGIIMFEFDVNVKITMTAGKSIVAQICKFVIKYLSEIKQNWISSSWGKRTLAEYRPTNIIFDCFTLCMVTYKMLTLKSRR